MNFRPQSRHGNDEPEINLIPFIDVLLVVLIFLMLTTTYSKFTELQVRLPVADAEAPRQQPREIVVAVARDGRYAVDRKGLDNGSVESLASALTTAANGRNDTVVIVSADAAASSARAAARLACSCWPGSWCEWWRCCSAASWR